MPGKPGMTGPNMGGRREGAGRPRTRFIARKGSVYTVDRQTIGGPNPFHPTELWTLLSIEDDEIEFQCGDDIIVITLSE